MADEAAQTNKRALETETEDVASPGDAPVGKKQKTEAAEAPAAAVADTGAEQAAAGQGAADEAATAAAAAGDEAAAAGGDGDAEMEGGEEEQAEEVANGTDEAAAAGAAAAGGPVKLGYRTFADSREASDYLQDVLKKATPLRKLNEYESLMLLDLLQKGHPNADQKLSGGLRAFVVAERRVEGNTTVCFHIKRLDNTLEDFSYRKCLQSLFPEYVLTNPDHSKGRGRGGRGRGGGRGGGGRFGGGGRGRGGSGGGRGRGGRGRGGRGRGRD